MQKSYLLERIKFSLRPLFIGILNSYKWQQALYSSIMTLTLKAEILYTTLRHLLTSYDVGFCNDMFVPWCSFLTTIFQTVRWLELDFIHFFVIIWLLNRFCHVANHLYNRKPLHQVPQCITGIYYFLSMKLSNSSLEPGI